MVDENEYDGMKDNVVLLKAGSCDVIVHIDERGIPTLTPISNVSL